MLVGATVALGVASPTPAAPAPDPSWRPAARAAAIELVRQTPTVSRGGTFELWLRLSDLPPDGVIELVLHGRVRSRSELAASREGDGLRSQVYNVATSIAELPEGADGTRHLAISLDPSVPGGIGLTTSGAYPVEIVAQDATGTTVTTLVTHLLLQPDEADESPPLAVAVVAELGAAPALQPDGSISLPASTVERMASLTAALTAVPDVPATLAATPETIEALAGSGDEQHAALLDQLRVAAAGRSVMARPYVDVSPDALVDAGLEAELTQQLATGRLVLADALGVDPSIATWVADPDLDSDGLAALQRAGARHVVVDPEQLQPLRSGVLSLSLAQPFLIDTDGEAEVDALALDPRIVELLDTTGSAGLEVSQLLAELAMLWFEQPGVPRGVVVPIGSSVDGQVLEGVLAGLDAGGIFDAVGLDDVFATASPLRQPGGGRVDRPLVPEPGGRISQSLAGHVQSTRSLLASFTSVVGADSPRSAPVAAQLLVATARGIDAEERRAHVDAARSSMEEVLGAVTVPEHETVTLTAREGTVPLTLGNDTGIPVNVVVRLRSPKLEFPDGDTISLTLTEATTRVDLAVRARTSGAIPLEVEVLSPDGALLLGAVDYSVQSTAVSGLGLVLSAGAAFFLMVWWARHWRRTRRSRKLVASTHPVHASPPEVTTSQSTGATPPQ